MLGGVYSGRRFFSTCPLLGPLRRLRGASVSGDFRFRVVVFEATAAGRTSGCSSAAARFFLESVLLLADVGSGVDCLVDCLLHTNSNGHHKDEYNEQFQ